MTDPLWLEVDTTELVLEVEAGGVQQLLVLTRPSWGGQGGGGAAPTEATLSFAYGDASPLPVFTLPVAALIVSASLSIRTAFDGAGASLQLGMQGQPGRLIPSNDIAPDLEAQYETYPDLPLAAGTQILLTITPGTGATRGAGAVVIDYLPL